MFSPSPDCIPWTAAKGATVQQNATLLLQQKPKSFQLKQDGHLTHLSPTMQAHIGAVDSTARPNGQLTPT